MKNEKPSEEAFHKLSFYTLAHPDMIYFIHQHIVDAYQAQTASATSKPIGLIFSLVGLYLYIEKGYTGRQVQQMHMKLAQNKKEWPEIKLPGKRGAITVSEVLKKQPGEERDKMIHNWCVSVWNAYSESHQTIEALVKAKLGII